MLPHSAVYIKDHKPPSFSVVSLQKMICLENGDPVLAA